MFESFKSFVSDFVDGEKHPSQFADNDYRLAAGIRCDVKVGRANST